MFYKDEKPYKIRLMISNLLFRTKHFILLLPLFFCSLSYSQSNTFANVIVSEDEVTASNNAIDSNLSTEAQISASSGIALGIGAYSGHLELEYATTVPANTTSFVKIEAEDDILSSLLGGSLANLLSNMTGTLLLGNQEFDVAIKNNSNTVLNGSSSSLVADNLGIVIDENNGYHLAISPDAPYNRIRLTNRVGSLIGLGNTRNLDVAGAYYASGSDNCGEPAFTSFDGNGITLDVLNIAGSGVTNPNLAIDGDPLTASEIGFGVLGVAADIEQVFYFDLPTDPTDQVYFNIAMDPSLLQAGIANNIEFIGENNDTGTTTSFTLSDLLDLDVLGLLENNDIATIAIDPNIPLDRVSVRLSSLLNVSLDQQMQVYEVFSAPERPIISGSSQNIAICTGDTADLVAEVQNATGTELRWYDAAVNGNLLATVNSGEAYTTPVLTDNVTYYVASAKIGCPTESPRVAVDVEVFDIPTANDITVVGNENPICSSADVVLVPSSTIDGSFGWYFDANRTQPIADGMVVGGATYTIDSDGILTITGLTEVGSPHTYFVDITQASAGCTNVIGDLKTVEVDIVDSTANVSINSITDLTLTDLLNIVNNNASINVNGTVSGVVTPGEEVSLIANGQVFTGTVATDSTFDILVDGIDLITDPDNTIDALVNGALCTLTETLPIGLPELIIDNVSQVFCAIDLATVADLQVNTSDVVFFNDLLAGTELNASTPLVNGEVYFAGLLNVPTSVLARIQVTVEIIDTPAPTTTSTTQLFCTDQNPTVADIQVNEPNVVFYDSETSTDPLEADEPLVDQGTYYATNIESGCESDERLMITVEIKDNEPMSFTGEIEEACQNRSYTYSTDVNKQNYNWQVVGGVITEGGTTTDNFATVEWTELQGAQLNVSYEDDQSCEPIKSISQEITVTTCGMVLGEEFCLFVYNEFSPNNDGFNDFFEIECIETYSSTVKIYNRNGNLVFQANDYQNNWNGVANVNGVLNSGTHLPSGTYYYVIDIPELERNFAGWLQLAR